MIYKYELACREAGLTEEETATIRRYFDAEKKKLKREKKTREKKNIRFVSTEEMLMEEGETYEILDELHDTEEEALHHIYLDQLKKAMDELPEDDREFLYAVFADYFDAEKRIAKKLGLTRSQVQYRKRKLVADLRKRMGY